MADDRELQLEHTRMTFGEHLTEFRTRLLRSALVLLAAFIAASIWSTECMRFIVAPYQNVMKDLGLDPTLKSAGPTQPFVTWFKVSLYVSLLVAAPYWLQQLWGFIAAGL